MLHAYGSGTGYLHALHVTIDELLIYDVTHSVTLPLLRSPFCHIISCTPRYRYNQWIFHLMDRGSVHGHNMVIDSYVHTTRTHNELLTIITSSMEMQCNLKLCAKGDPPTLPSHTTPHFSQTLYPTSCFFHACDCTSLYFHPTCPL